MSRGEPVKVKDKYAVKIEESETNPALLAVLRRLIHTNLKDVYKRWEERGYKPRDAINALEYGDLIKFNRLLDDQQGVESKLLDICDNHHRHEEAKEKKLHEGLGGAGGFFVEGLDVAGGSGRGGR